MKSIYLRKVFKDLSLARHPYSGELTLNHSAGVGI